MPFIRRVGRITEVRRSPGELFLEWSIYGFLELPAGVCNYYESSRFSLSDAFWYFRVYPKCLAQDWVYLSLFRDDDDFPSNKHVIFGFGVKGSHGVEKKTERSVEFDVNKGTPGCHTWCDMQFCRRSDLSTLKNILMPNNTLTITCEIKVPGDIAVDSSDLSDNCEVEVRPEIEELSENGGGKKALEDFGKLLASGEGSDVIIQVGDNELMVHSFVLFARCPALAMSLKHESKEKASKRIVIEEYESNVFRHFLQHLYTGSVLSLTEQNVFSLYRIAHKYMVDDLKKQCLEHLKNSLSVQTFCGAIELALTHDERDLLLMAIDFAAQNIRQVVCSLEWQNFLRERPTEANEIFIKSLGRPCDSEKDKK